MTNEKKPSAATGEAIQELEYGISCKKAAIVILGALLVNLAINLAWLYALLDLPSLLNMALLGAWVLIAWVVSMIALAVIALLFE